MPSHASQAQKATERDRAGRPNLTVVASPPATKGDEARAAVVAELPDYQQAEYARLRESGTRHVTALAAARKLPDPNLQTGDIDQAAADLFAAFAAGQAGGAKDPASSLGAAVKPDPEPEPVKPPVATPKPKVPVVRAPRVPKPKPAPAQPGAQTTATVEAVPYDRYIGTVTIAILGEGGTADEAVIDCAHAAKNGHITQEAAQSCANKLLGAHVGGTTGTRVRDRYNGAYTPKAGGARALCGCRFGHKTEDAAISCARDQAARAGLSA